MFARLIIVIFFGILLQTPAYGAQIVLISDKTFRPGLNNIGDIVIVLDDAHEFSKWEKEAFTFVSIPGTVEYVRNIVHSVQSTKERTGTYSHKLDNVKLQTIDLSTKDVSKEVTTTIESEIRDIGKVVDTKTSVVVTKELLKPEEFKSCVTAND